MHVWPDLNDNNLADAGEEIAGLGGADNFNYPADDDRHIGAPLWRARPFPCTWDPTTSPPRPHEPANRQQNATQAFFFVNNFHDWLAQAPISASRPPTAPSRPATRCWRRTTTAPTRGAPRRRPRSRPGHQPHRQREHGHAARRAVADDADVPVPPQPGPFERSRAAIRSCPPTAATRPTSSTTSTRTASRTGSSSTRPATRRCSRAQADSMGEAWSDWYAMDYLADTQSCAPRRACPTRRGRTRSSARTCPTARSAPTRSASRRSTARSASVDALLRLAERRRPGRRLHLRQLRQDHRRARGARRRRDLGPDAVGSAHRARRADWRGALVTRAMELSPDDPSYLDMRNAILQADTVLQRRRRPRPRSGRCSRTAAWATSPARSTADDTAPVARLLAAAGRARGQGHRPGTVHRRRHARARGGRARRPSPASTPASPATPGATTAADRHVRAAGPAGRARLPVPDGRRRRLRARRS